MYQEEWHGPNTGVLYKTWKQQAEQRKQLEKEMNKDICPICAQEYVSMPGTALDGTCGCTAESDTESDGPTCTESEKTL